MDPATGSTVTTDSILSAVRTLLGVAGGYFVGKGYLTQDQLTQVVTALLLLGPVAWGVLEKFSAEKKTQVRIAAAANPAPVNVIQATQDVAQKGA